MPGVCIAINEIKLLGGWRYSGTGTIVTAFAFVHDTAHRPHPIQRSGRRQYFCP
jgi:hypothetical protein